MEESKNGEASDLALEFNEMSMMDDGTPSSILTGSAEAIREAAKLWGQPVKLRAAARDTAHG